MRSLEVTAVDNLSKVDIERSTTSVETSATFGFFALVSVSICYHVSKQQQCVSKQQQYVSIQQQCVSKQQQCVSKQQQYVSNCKQC